MAQDEMLLLKRGQPHFEPDIKTLFKMVTNEKHRLFFLFSQYIKMQDQIKSRSIDVSYLPNDIFVGKHLFATFEREHSDFFKNRLRSISKNIEVRISQEDEIVSFLVFIKEPDWEIEEQIYDVYGSLLDEFPDSRFHLEVVELFGKKPKDFIS